MAVAGLSPLAWTLTDGHAGNRRQAGALAAALGGTAREVVLQSRAPWRWLAPRRLPGAAHAAFGTDFARTLAQPPRLAIGCGRQAALATRLLRERALRQAQSLPRTRYGDERVKTVQILDPRIDPSHWDLVVVPQHDGLRGDNVVTLLGSLNPVDDAWLAEARAQFATFAELPSPRTALLLGGDSAHWHFDAAAFEALAAKLEAALVRDGGSLLATASRRTPAGIADALRTRFGKFQGVVWRGEADGGASNESNPYPGLLAWADRIVCTPDSVNMLSEACATRAPVFVFEPWHLGGRPRNFVDALLTRGRVREMDAALVPFEAEPLRETERVAAIVKERLGLQSDNP